MLILRLAIRSLWNRRGTALLTLSAIAISVALLLGVQKLRNAASEGFANTVSGTDLIVGARSGPLNLLLYSIFRVGDATANVSWASYQKIARHPDVEWTIPISLGDSHRGFRVMGTTADFFLHYHYAGERALVLREGRPFSALYDVVLGADVARQLGYRIGQQIVLSHGIGEVSFAEHRDKPFTIVGILAKTGTPVDRTVHVSLQAITALHEDFHGAAGSVPPGGAPAPDPGHDLTPQSITAFLVGMRSRVMTFTMQRAINEYRQEALLAIIPGMALKQLWDLVSIADTALRVVAGFVVLAGLLGMLTAILTSLGERRREMAILRSVGAQPRHVFALLVLEAGLLALLGVLLGVALAYALLLGAQPWLEQRYGIFVQLGGLGAYDLALLGGIIACALVIGLIPAWRAYRTTLGDGLTIRI